MSEIEKENVKSVWLLGLECTDCAAKIEKAVGKLEGVQSVNVNIMTEKMTIMAENNSNLPILMRQAVKIASKIEPDIEISYTERKTDEEVSVKKKRLFTCIVMSVGVILFILGLAVKFRWQIELSIFVASYILIGGKVVWYALKNISRGQVFDENFLMSIASIGAFIIGEYPEGVAVMLFYQVGETFQEYAVQKSRKSITSLMDIRPDFANLKVGSEVRRVSPDEVSVSDIIIVKPGEKIPLDGIVVEGYSALDTSALTGESLPRDVIPGSEVLSGSINENGLLTIKVIKEFGESTVAKILDLVQNANASKAPVENFITKFARYYTPIVVIAAILLAGIPPLFFGGEFFNWLQRALVFLVVSCPCALVISIPLSFFGGIGGASRNGILVKGSNYLEALNDVSAVVFDKTGTLTKGVFSVTKVAPADGFHDNELLRIAAYAESNSNHPIALSIREAYGKAIDNEQITEYEEIAGLGIRVKIDGKIVLAGNARFMSKENIAYKTPDTVGTVVYLSVDNNFSGYIIISDELKEDSKKSIESLKSLGIKKTIMLTGDSNTVGERIGKNLGIDSIYAELLPHQKVEKFEEIASEKSDKGNLLFVGDGINDAPVLARADVGIAMGGVGSDAAIEAADIVLMTDELSKIVSAMKIAKKTRRIVWQNIIFALGVKGIILVLGALGLANMWEAVFGDVGVALIAVLNAMRAMKSL
ncbi:MAG: cadmium-translocating P-type ATPase [Clostridiales Family XIII bacterium]|jgi:Cd2+/Zn2+-exporting ATPase|nr:cadmium-translocating P-type ATPase [Clostridiales Family XIII bacterium]